MKKLITIILGIVVAVLVAVLGYVVYVIVAGGGIGSEEYVSSFVQLPSGGSEVLVTDTEVMQKTRASEENAFEVEVLGVYGDVSEEMIPVDDEVFGKSAVDFTGVREEIRQVATAQYYSEYDLSELVRISGEVVAVDPDGRRVKVSTGDSSGWIKLLPIWSGNSLVWDPEVDGYTEEQSFDVLEEGAWDAIFDSFGKSGRVVLTCVDSNCYESVGGHIIMD